mmetsp:Transcript_2677/g.9620  ORF Transcript_2677/g.9620 Transcript_2677/m.9620 type:complete len:92 (-) Transcript_2677:619-894(-)
MPAPPKIFRTHFWTLTKDDCQEIIRIHAHVDPRIECGTEVCIPTWSSSRNHPPYERDGTMMIHMKETDLSEIILQEHNKGVEEFVYLTDVK